MPSTRFNRIGRAFAMVADAVAVSAAVRENRTPNAHNLRGLGIDPDQFRKIGR